MSFVSEFAFAHPSLAYLTVRGTEPWKQIEYAKQSGYSHVGLRFNPVLEEEELLPIVGHSDRLSQTKKALADTGIKLLDMEFFWINPETKVKEFLPYMEAGAELGAQIMLVGCNDPDRNRITQHWLELCDLAQSYSLQPSLEFMPISELKSYAEAIGVVLSAPRPNGRAMIDALHFDRSLSKVSEIRAEHLPLLSYLQLCDAPRERPTNAEELRREAKSDRLPPGEGGIDLAGLIRTLPANLPISVEVPLAGERHKWSAFRKAELAYHSTLSILERIQAPR